MKTVDLLKDFTENDFIEKYFRAKKIFDVDEYLNPKENCLDLPERYYNMNKAFETFMKHKNCGSKIGVLVDVDTDGLMSAGIVANFCYKILNTKPLLIFHEGLELKTHGLSGTDLMDYILHSELDLLIVPDAGSNDVKNCMILNDLGLKDIIILDHHNIEQENNYAVVINNQHSKNLDVKNRYLSGAGVTYKFVEYVCHKLNIDTPYYMDMVAFSILSDVCDLTSLENRYFVKNGLANINNQGLKMLVNEFIKDDLTPKSVVWSIVPKLNAMLRFENTYLKRNMMKLFSGIDIEDVDIEAIKKELKYYHRKQSTITKEWSEEMVPNINPDDKVVMLSGDNCEYTFTGLIAGKIADITKKPTLITRNHGKTITGSCRTSNSQFYQLCADSGLFNFVAGHDKAFGFSFQTEKEFEIKKYFNSLDLKQETVYDVTKTFNMNSGKPITIPNKLFEICEEYESVWGQGIEKPLFAIKGIKLKGTDIVELGRNKTTISFNYNSLKYIAFFMSKKEKDHLHIGENILLNLDIIGEFNINHYNGLSSPQVVIEKIEATPIISTNNWSDNF